MTQNKKRLGLTVSVPLYEKLMAIATYQGKTLNSTCLDIFWNYFEQRKDDPQCGNARDSA